MRDQKTDMRRRVLGQRDMVTPREAHKAADAVARSGLDLVRRLAPPPAIVASYWPIRSEISARPLIDALNAAGYRTALPVTQGAGKPLLFRAWTPGDDFEHGSFGLSHPPASAETVDPTFLFCPLAVFDAAGGRIGYGAGHYDATLARRRAEGRVIAAGLAYAIQEVDVVACEPHDQRLDFVITEERIFTIGTI